MADILKVSTPLVDRSNAMHPNNKQPPPTDGQFQLNELSKVVKTNPQSELLQQNNGMPTREEAPAILMDLLRDPAVSMHFLKNIYMLQEIIGLIPAGNQALTQEINQLFDALMMQPGQITGELLRQEDGATMFRGDLFDMLRNLLQSSTPEAGTEMRDTVANLLKSMSAALSKDNILASVSNNLSFMANQLTASKAVSERLNQLAEKFLHPNAQKDFPQLKAQTMLLLREVEGSILFTPKLQRMIPLITYNLSRYNDNPDYLQDTANSMMKLLETPEQRARFLEGLKSFLQEVPLRRAFAGVEDGERTAASKVMTALVKLLGKEAASKELTTAGAEKLDKIIQSLLSSPCNFTPLLHFVIPVEDDGLHAFAELWIDASEDEDAKGGEGGDGMHVLAVFDVEGVGQFEAELMVRGKKLGINLFCPPEHLERFIQLRDYAAKITAGTGYSLTEVYVGGLERSRSLMDVFKTLPHRRTGIDVKA